MFRYTLCGIAAVAIGCFVLGCDSKDPNAGSENAPTTSSTESKTTTPPPPAPTPPPDRHLVFKNPKVQKGDIAVIETDFGTIKFELSDKTPKHAANFEKLADAGFYDGTAFHRVKPGFMIQGGDQNTLGTDESKYGQGDPGWTVPAEFNDTKFDRGIVGMARSQDPNSAGSQFFIVVAPSYFLNKQYTAFGKVISGMDAVDKIVQVPTVGAPTDQVIDINKTRVKSIKIIHPGGK